MISKETIEKELILFLSAQCNIPVAQIKSTDELRGLGLDSFRIIELVLFIERKFGIAIPDQAYTPGNLKSIESLVNCSMEYIH